MRSYIFRNIESLAEANVLWNRIRGDIVRGCQQGPIEYTALVHINNTMVRASVATVCCFQCFRRRACWPCMLGRDLLLRTQKFIVVWRLCVEDIVIQPPTWSWLHEV